MLIGEVAQRSGISVQTVRFYERQGLLAAAHRRDSGYREYPPDVLQRLRFVRQAKELGFSLLQIREILSVREKGRCPCSEVTAFALTHLKNTEAQIRNLTQFASELRKALRKWKRTGQSTVSADVICSLIERTIQ